ncbi:MAG: ATP-binding protein [Bacteroidales bacterium]|nr:ATP-binding protein [Bacteroidales bacterium]
MNPFSYGTIVKSPYFYDRTMECQRIVSTLSGGNNLTLFAPRRFGKTSLVFRAIEDLEKMDYICIYFDFMPVYSRESFIEAYSKAILAKQSNLQRAVKSMATLVKGIRPKIVFDQSGKPEFSMDFTDDLISEKTLEDIIDLPEKLASERKRFVIIFDEFQEINKLNGENFEKLLRSKIQQQQFVTYMFLGSRTHLLNDMFNNKTRAFYNAAMLMQLSTLPENETIEFLKNRFALSNITIDDSSAVFLIEQAGNIPYYIQLLAAEVWQYLVSTTKDLNTDIIAICAEGIVDLKNDYYFELYDRQSSYQKKLLKSLLVCGENVFSADYAKRFRLSATSTTQKALLVLVENGIVEKVEGTYFIGDPFFKRFLSRYA